MSELTERLFRRIHVAICARRGHNYREGYPCVCQRCGHVDPPPECWHCHEGTFSDFEPIMDTPCCNACGRSIMQSRGGLPHFDNAGSIPRPLRGSDG